MEEEEEDRVGQWKDDSGSQARESDRRRLPQTAWSPDVNPVLSSDEEEMWDTSNDIISQRNQSTDNDGSREQRTDRELCKDRNSASISLFAISNEDMATDQIPEEIQEIPEVKIVEKLEIIEEETTYREESVQGHSVVREDNSDSQLLIISQDPKPTDPTEISLGDLSAVINEVQVNSLDKRLEPSVAEIHCFKHGTEPILAINAFCDEFTWFHCNNSKFTERMNDQGKVTKQIYIGGWTSSFVVLNSGDMVYTEFEGCTMQKVYKTGKVEEFWTTKPLMPLGVGLALDGGLLVCLVDKDCYDVGDDSMRMVQHLTEEGQLTETYEYAEDKETRLFNFPYRVAENFNTDICVVDRQSKDVVIIKVVSFDRRLKFMYHGNTNTKDRFHPSGIVCDSYCRIIITDFNNHCIHVLSEEGAFLKFLTTDNDGLKYPYCLSLYDDSRLWVGCKDGVIRVYDYIT